MWLDAKGMDASGFAAVERAGSGFEIYASETGAAG
jgi:hypothetical protein